uniref:DNA-directed RNA polymerase subunit n=1 Tax=Meloidogyne hapla TaxID=6305 RepID=A0A1I8BH69_MELHA
MASSADLSVKQNRSFMLFDAMEMKIYTSEEVRKISVMEITKADTFDEVGFPVRGGLYDCRLGPSEGFCDTCKMSDNHCPGHYGHIELAVPVFNPLLFSFTNNIMKATCIHCHRFTIDSNSIPTKILIAKLRAIDFGLSEILASIGGEIKNRIGNGEAIGDKIELLGEQAFLREIDSIIAKLANIDSVDCLHSKNYFNQNILRNDLYEKEILIKTYLKELLKRKTRCPICKRPNGILRNDFKKAFLLDFTKQKSAGHAQLPQVSIEDLRPDLGIGGGIEFDADFDKKFDLTTPKFKSTDISFTSSLCDQLLDTQLQQIIIGKCDKLAWRASEVREHFRMVWQREGFLLKHLFPLFNEKDEGFNFGNLPSVDSLFIETVLVEPSRFRPIRYLHSDKFEHSVTSNLRKLLEASQLILLIKLYIKTDGKDSGIAAKEMIESRVPGKTMNEKLHNAYLELQMRANVLYDKDANKLDTSAGQVGLRQTLEKKEGLFRMHMMGKRVNYACRSVITPDPYLDIDEIGIPELFARRLTFPEALNDRNIYTMRELVKRGPDKHPGASFIEVSGKLGKPPMRLMLKSGPTFDRDRGFYASRLHAGNTHSVHSMPDVVLRSLQNGDRMLMNRQPTLHKPSIMGHRVRVLHSQKALRMNYAPCKAYNADFDGDEMNGHFVQNRVAQSEIAELASVGSNFLVPKDGTPILGLIQDHVVSGVLMTLRGQFFNKEDFMHLILSAFSQCTEYLSIPPPTIIKPQKLWSGKQVLTAIIQNCCPSDKPQINLTGKAKTPLTCWKARDPLTGDEMNTPSFEMSESNVIIRRGQLLCGVLDKAHYGTTQFGLIHCVYELYGPKVAVKMLSCFSRVFTTHLQFHGFSLGVSDILVTKKADTQRKSFIEELRSCGDSVVQKAFSLPEDTPSDKIRYTLATTYNHPRDREMVKMVDFSMKQTINKYAEQINSACVPSGLIKDFPRNSLQLMIQSGAKGSLVNSIQISCALGQIELEGQRPPLSITGRSLPSFKSFDPSPRAGGFVEQRFLTGINPQELFFHTMAGREGLIDTAVKTSRSGYLQRCIIKHLEGISIRYDNTVRNFDDSIIQFRYGEDGLDVGRSTFLNSKQFPFLVENIEAIQKLFIPSFANPEEEKSKWNLLETEEHYKRISKFKQSRIQELKGKGQNADFANINKNKRFSAFNQFHQSIDSNYLLKDSLAADWNKLTKEEREIFIPKDLKPPEPVDVVFHPATNLGSLPESFLNQLNDFVQKSKLENSLDLFKRSIYWKGLRAYADPGESVGLLAAQSIGEPSTQMTLNTFHFAGRGEMNVTLGIPRLREILMTQGKSIATPMAEICIRPEVTEEQVQQLKSEFNPVTLRHVLKNFSLVEGIVAREDGLCFRQYIVRLELLKNKKRDPIARHLRRKKIMLEIESRFVPLLSAHLIKRDKDVFEQQQIQQRKIRGNDNEAGGEQGETNKKGQDEFLASDEEDAMADLQGELDAHEERLNRRHLDGMAEYEGEEQDRGDSGIVDEFDDELNEVEGGGEEDSEAELPNDDDKDDNEEEDPNNIKNANKFIVDEERVNMVTKGCVRQYIYDVRNERWCSITFELRLRNKCEIDVPALVEREIDKFIVTQINKVEKCIIRSEERNGKMTQILQTQGINLEAFYNRVRFLDVNTIYSNDINVMLNCYGVEAANRTIVKEMNNVFGVYGIEVNPRHLTLTADYMTFGGDVQAFNRSAMAQSPSPLQKMTYETTMAFMQKAIISGHSDSLFSPSARIVMGQLIREGTGSFDLLTSPEYALYRPNNKGEQENIKPISETGNKIEQMRRKRHRRKTQFHIKM